MGASSCSKSFNKICMYDLNNEIRYARYGNGMGIVWEAAYHKGGSMSLGVPGIVRCCFLCLWRNDLEKGRKRGYINYRIRVLSKVAMLPWCNLWLLKLFRYTTLVESSKSNFWHETTPESNRPWNQESQNDNHRSGFWMSRENNVGAQISWTQHELSGGFNPFEKYQSNWNISPNRDAHLKKYLSCHHPEIHYFLQIWSLINNPLADSHRRKCSPTD